MALPTRSDPIEANLLPDTIQFNGELNEFSKPDAFSKIFDQLGQVRGEIKGAKLDFSQVTRANSSGIVIWLRFFEKIEDHFNYVNTPVWLVNQFNMISDFLGKSSIVSDFQAPFFCEATEGSLNLKFFPGDDLPLLETYRDYDVPNRIIDGKEFEPDFEPSAYFDFLTKIKGRY